MSDCPDDLKNVIKMDKANTFFLTCMPIFYLENCCPATLPRYPPYEVSCLLVGTINFPTQRLKNTKIISEHPKHKS